MNRTSESSVKGRFVGLECWLCQLRVMLLFARRVSTVLDSFDSERESVSLKDVAESGDRQVMEFRAEFLVQLVLADLKLHPGDTNNVRSAIGEPPRSVLRASNEVGR
jgi:hypothetical protein